MVSLSVPASNTTWSTIDSPATFSAPQDGTTSGLATPYSSAGPSSGKDAKSTSNGNVVSDATTKLRQELGRKLEALVATEESKPPLAQPAIDLPTALPPPSSLLPEFECAFGFDGSIYKPVAVPQSKSTFLVAIRGEIEGIAGIQRGLQSYQTAINSREYHTFSTEFLVNQNTATIITIDQLDQIVAHLKKVEKEVQGLANAYGEVKEELINGFRQAQPWVMRTRAVLRHCHVFYKINFVLASQKRSTRY